MERSPDWLLAQSFGCCRGASRKFAMPGLGLSGHLSQKKQIGKSQKIPAGIQKKGRRGWKDWRRSAGAAWQGGGQRQSAAGQSRVLVMHLRRHLSESGRGRQATPAPYQRRRAPWRPHHAARPAITPPDLPVGPRSRDQKQTLHES